MKPEIKQLNKYIKELDALIIDQTKEISIKGLEYNIKVSLFDSLGELYSDYLTLSYMEEPNENEIVRDIREELKYMKEDLNKSDILTARDEAQFNALRGLIL